MKHSIWTANSTNKIIKIIIIIIIIIINYTKVLISLLSSCSLTFHAFTY